MIGKNVYVSGNKTVNHDREYHDSHTRTFIGHPDMNDEIKKMLQFWAKRRKYKKILLFFMVKCKFDEEYSVFLLRELVRRNI